MTGESGRQAPAPSMNPQAQSHEALKAMTDAADPGAAQAVADGWAEMAAGFDEAARLFQRTVLSSATGWTGDAAEAMRTQLARIALWSEKTGAQYQAASGAITEQTGAADTAKRNMPPPVPYDPGQMIRDARESGNMFEMAALPFKMYAQKQRHDAAHEQAVEVVGNRDSSFAAAAGSIPAFIPPPSLTEEPKPEVGSKSEAQGKPPVSGPPVPRARGAAPAPVVPAAAPPAPNAGPSAPPTPPSPAPPSAPTPPRPPSGSAPSIPSQGGTNAAGFTSAPSPGRPAGPGFGGPPVMPASAGGFPPGGGFGPATGGLGGVGPTGGRPPAPVRRPAALPVAGKGAEDGEQKRPEYLIEPEIEGMFGSDEMTSPPVIGEG
jgi:hypothetical protein